MRARSLKPGFFENEQLAELEPFARILYAGLWCYSDKEGRFEWRPKRIKALIFPYDNVDVSNLLHNLKEQKFIVQYSVDGSTYGWMPTFKKHQNPHPHEAKSVIPPFENSELNQCHDMSLHVTKCTASSLTPSSLTPSSLTPSSLTPDSSFIEVDTSIVPEAAASGTSGIDKPKRNPKSKDCPHQEILQLYREILPELPQIEWTDDRAIQLRTRWREKPERQCLDWWKEYFNLIRRCPWLMGENERGWIADFEWLTRKKNLPKVLDGKYLARNGGKDSTLFTKQGQHNARVAQAYLERMGPTCETE